MSNLMQYGIQKCYPQLEREIQYLMDVNRDCIETVTTEDIAITTPFTSDSAYCYQVYVPSQNIIYFTPRSQHNINRWHYFNVTENKMYEYNPFTTFDGYPYDYYGGIYDYKYNRIVLLPCIDIQGSIYIDISSVPPRVKKNSTNSLLGGYKFKGVADIFNNRIYTCPYAIPSYYIDYIDTSNPTSIEYTSVLITNSTVLYHPNYASSQVIIREDGSVYYLFPDTVYVYHHTLNNTSEVFRSEIYGNPEHSINGYPIFGSNQVYIPHLKRSYAGFGNQYLDYTSMETKTITQVSSKLDRTFAINGLNGRIYHLSSDGVIDVTDISSNSISNLNTNVTLGENTLSTSIMTSDGKIIIFPISSSQVSGTTKVITINLNLKVKPSIDLLLSGLINL